MRRDLWVSLRPNGIGLQKPNHYREMAEAAWAVRRRPRRAWRILTRGVCDGCSLGVAGLHDWTIDGIHLCTTRLRLLEVNCADPLEDGALSDVGALRRLDGAGLRSLGRLAHPMRRRRGERGFRRISWDEALEVLCGGLASTDPSRLALYLTSRGLTNETYYVAGKAARAMGSANIDSAARVCHSPSTLGLKATVGVAAMTCSLTDVIESDLVVLWGANPANSQPVFMKYLYLARRRGTRVIVVNPVLEPGLDRYWVPSNLESALFGTRMCDLHVPVRPGGDVAFANLVIRRLVERDLIDRPWIEAHTRGFGDLVRHVTACDPDALREAAGVDEAAVEGFCDLYGAARSAVLVWAMGVTQWRTGVAGVRAIVNVALARGNVGRDGAGLVPLRGHSGVQGGAEMGAYATALPGGLPVDPGNAGRLSARWGFPVPDRPGLTAPGMVEAAARGELDVLWTSGGSFVDVLADPAAVAAALERIPLRVHSDIVVSRQMLVDGDDVVLLPVATRYEQEGGGTETTTERRIVYSPRVVDPPGEARSEWRLFAEVARRVRPELSGAFAWPSGRDLRAEIAEVVPLYAGIERLEATGDNVQWGGRHLCADGRFPTPDGRARFSVVDAAPPRVGPGEVLVVTRRGKQFNSMVFAATDPLTGAGRDDVLMDPSDAARRGLADGDPVRLVNEVGEMAGRVRLVPMPPGTVQVHWPEGNVLIAGGPAHRDPDSGIPEYRAVARLERC